MKTDKDKRIEIIRMYQRGYKVMEISKELGIEKSVVSKAIKRFNELGTSADRKGRKRTARTQQMIRIIKRKIQRGEDNKRKLAREEGIDEKSVRTIVKQYLKSKSYKKQEAHYLNDNMMKVRKQRMFRIDRLSSRMKNSSPLKKNSTSRIAELSLGISKEPTKEEESSKEKLFHSSPNITAKQFSKRNFSRVLEGTSEDAIGAVNKTAPSHKAEAVQNWIRETFPEFIKVDISKKKPDQWPPNSPDLNPLDYAIWGILEAVIYGKKFNTIDELKAALRRAWSRIDVNMLALLWITGRRDFVRALKPMAVTLKFRRTF
uniref:Transposase n=1 Tax=Acrobeloides nanus TaxID=290746 RepID=A0A914E4X2_9BILA